MMTFDFKGECLGIRLGARKDYPGDNHVLVTLLSGRGEHWLEDTSFSSHWLDEVIMQLQLAKTWMEQYCEKDKPLGYKFKE
jgi:hypothetical protein